MVQVGIETKIISTCGIGLAWAGCLHPWHGVLRHARSLTRSIASYSPPSMWSVKLVPTGGNLFLSQPHITNEVNTPAKQNKNSKQANLLVTSFKFYQYLQNININHIIVYLDGLLSRIFCEMINPIKLYHISHFLHRAYCLAI